MADTDRCEECGAEIATLVACWDGSALVVELPPSPAGTVLRLGGDLALVLDCSALARRGRLHRRHDARRCTVLAARGDGRLVAHQGRRDGAAPTDQEASRCPP